MYLNTTQLIPKRENCTLLFLRVINKVECRGRAV